jgi:hypothetical protein
MTIFGVFYPSLPGTLIDVPEGVAMALKGGGWRQFGQVGPTSDRPPSSDIYPYFARAGMLFYDTTLAAWITYDGATWRSTTTGAAV